MRPRGAPLLWDPGTANPKQREFFRSRALYTAYGGAKGGGKTWAVRTKALLGAYYYPGIRILIMRRTYPELLNNHIEPMRQALRPAFAKYSAERRAIYFANGSVIRFGHWAGERSEGEYNGQEYDWIFIDEATQFTWRAFQFLGSLLRGVNDIPKRMYLTCNPGGVGHRWVKRLFIDRDFITGRDDPEENEDPADYVFIPATVEDNEALLRASPGYLRLLSALPEDLRRACRYGDWGALGGSYFSEFDNDAHTCESFVPPRRWRRYRSFDYGLDMFACAWFAVDGEGRAWMYREYAGSGLTAGEAARQMLLRTPEGEEIEATFAPPDMWSRQREMGRTIADIFFENGAALTRAPNARAQGHMLVKELLQKRADGRPGLIFMRCCRETIDDMRDIQSDERDPNDCAREPHEVTHRVDAVRYFCASRFAPAESGGEDGTEDEEDKMSYFEFMTGRRPGKGETWL